MAFQNDKGELFERMGVFKELNGLPKTKKTNSIEAVNSTSKNLLPFLLVLLKSSCLDNATSGRDKARCSVNNILLGILIEFLPALIKIVKEGIIKGIKAGLACGTDFTIPNPTPSMTTTIDKIDLNDMMKIDPNGIGGLLFGNPTTDFNRFLLDIITSQGSGVWTDRGGVPLLDVNYNVPTSSTNNQPTITTKISNNRAGTSFHDFLVDYINSIELFSIKNITGGMMDYMFGTISSANNLGVDTLLNQSKTDMGVEKVLDIDVCADKIIIDDSYYEFNDDELLQMEAEANNKAIGVNVIDLGCGLVQVAVPPKLFDSLDELDTAPPKRVKEILELTIQNTGDAVSEFGSPENSQTMKDNVNTQSILSFPKILMRMVITPKIVSLYQVSHQTINNEPLDVNNGYDFSKSARTFFEFVTREATAALIELLFNKIKKELISLISQVVIKIIKEKIKLYISSIAGIYISDSIGGAFETIGTPNTSDFV